MSRGARGIFDPPIESYRPLSSLAYLFDLFMRWVETMLVPWKGRM